MMPPEKFHDLFVEYFLSFNKIFLQHHNNYRKVVNFFSTLFSFKSTLCQNLVISTLIPSKSIEIYVKYPLISTLKIYLNSRYFYMICSKLIF